MASCSRSGFVGPSLLRCFVTCYLGHESEAEPLQLKTCPDYSHSSWCLSIYPADKDKRVTSDQKPVHRMWKASAGHQIQATSAASAEDDDWETDPDFVNDVSEQEQRWGSKTIDGSGRTAGTIEWVIRKSRNTGYRVHCSLSLFF